MKSMGQNLRELADRHTKPEIKTLILELHRSKITFSDFEKAIAPMTVKQALRRV